MTLKLACMVARIQTWPIDSITTIKELLGTSSQETISLWGGHTSDELIQVVS